MSAKLRPVPAQRRMPVRTKRIDLDGEYEGWWCDVRTNVPAGALLHLQGLSEDEAAALDNLAHTLDFLAAIVTDWNFVDEEGDALPVGRAGCARLTPELVRAVMEGFNGAAATLPKDSPSS